MVQNWTADMATSLQKLSCCHLLVVILVPQLHYAGRVATRLVSADETVYFRTPTLSVSVVDWLQHAEVFLEKSGGILVGGVLTCYHLKTCIITGHMQILFLLKCSIWRYCWNVNSTQYYCQTILLSAVGVFHLVLLFISLSAVGVFHIVLLFECSTQCYC